MPVKVGIDPVSGKASVGDKTKCIVCNIRSRRADPPITYCDECYAALSNFITRAWGERCSDFEPNCCVCVAWHCYDFLVSASDDDSVVTPKDFFQKLNRGAD